MKKTLVKSCLTVALALCAQATMADYLYFLVGDDSGNSPTYNDDPVVYSYATVKMTGAGDSSGYLELYAGGATESSGIAMMSGSTAPAYAKLPDNYKNAYSTFLVELWNGDANRVAWQSYGYDDVLGNIVGSNAQGKVLYVSEVVPEPTSGMLMLLGMAVLAMRRKTKMI